jgi:hypothetical protein
LTAPLKTGLLYAYLDFPILATFVELLGISSCKYNSPTYVRFIWQSLLLLLIYVLKDDCCRVKIDLKVLTDL